MVQLKLRGFSIIQDQWKQIDMNTAGNIFTQFLFAIQNFLGDLIGSFNNMLPSADQIHHLLDVVAPYLEPAVVIILVVCCLIFFIPYVLIVFGFLFSGISIIVGFLFGCISAIVGYIFSGLKKCLCIGGRETVKKMMTAPGMAPLLIARAVFEDSPRAYFAGLRMLSK